MEPLDGHALAAALPFVPSCILADGHEGEAAAVLAEAFPGAPFVLDAGSPRPGTERLVPSATHCIVSERYAASLLGKSRLGENEEVEEALRILARKARRSMAEAEGLCAVTLGARGCSYTGDGSSFSHLPAFHVPVVDSTGAGDIFHGAAAYALAVGLDGRSALTLASAAAALSVGKSGGFASIPSREDSEALSRRTGRQ
jgi:sugar/nucleoside kinase (ribokinase family)